MVWSRSNTNLGDDEIKCLEKKNELQVQVEQLPDVFEDNGLALVKIEDDKVINRIISAVPQLHRQE